MKVQQGWYKSSRSGAAGHCVEINRDNPGAVQVRHSQNPDGPVLTFNREEWLAFTGGARDGEFDI